MPSLGETVVVAWAKAFSLSENSADLHFYFPVSVVAGCYHEHACVIWFVWTESGMLGLIYGMELLVGGVVAWELDVWDKSCGYGMRNMNLVWDRRNSMRLVGRSHGGV